MTGPTTAPAGRLALAALVALAVLGLAACSDDGDGTPTQVALTVPQEPRSTAPAPTMPDDCQDKGPGEIMSAAEAIVRFSTEIVCPGYVTITVGTPVTFTNTAEESLTVEVTATDASGAMDDLPFFGRSIAAGGSVEYTFEETGLYAYTIDALEGFRGTIEVLPPEGFDAAA